MSFFVALYPFISHYNRSNGIALFRPAYLILTTVRWT